MEDKEKKDNDNWLRLPSKSRPGRFYMFNKATGEKKWLPSSKDSESNKKPEKLPQTNLSKNIKTPAQDRLKRLQHNLKAQNSNNNSRSSHQSSSTKTDSEKQQENHINVGSPTSITDKNSTKSPKKAIKRHHSSSLPTEDENETSAAKTSPNNKNSIKFPKKPTKRHHSSSLHKEDENATKVAKTSQNEKVKKPEFLENPTTSKNSSATYIEVEATGKSILPAVNNTTEEVQTVNSGITSALSNFKTGIVKKIKEICKIPFSAKETLAQEKSKSLVNTSSFKATKRIRENQQHLSNSLQDAILRELRTETGKKSNLNTSLTLTSLIPPKNLKVPTYSRGSANSRLNRLKQSLLAQQQQTLRTNGITNTAETSSEIPVSDSVRKDDNLNTSENNSVMLHDGNSSNSLQHTTNNEVIEAMDWQPIPRDEETTLNQSTTSIDSGFTIEKSKKCLLLIKDANDCLTMGDIYDTVNQNLLRYSAEKQNDSIRSYDKWRKDFYYFIVDTNVLINNLTFVEDLTKMKLCDTEGSMLYIPYTVLQELDKLKMRTGIKEGVKTLAIRAIKYLNEKFEQQSSHIKAQSALDEREHLIDVISPDDSILNCCLQAKKHVPHLLLLTEDVNLRNKAICNNILVSTKSDLVLKRYDFNNSNKIL